MRKTTDPIKWSIYKSILTLVYAIVFCIGLAATSAMAADATLAVDMASAYVWRGQTFNDGTVIQPSIDVAAKNGLGVNVWANYDISDYNKTLNDNEFSEVDLKVYYGFSLDKVDVGLGVISYLFPAGAAETSEVYLSLGMEILVGLSTGLDIYYDIDAVDEFTYASLNLAYAYDFNENLGMEIGGSIGYAGDKFSKNAGGKDGGLYDYTFSISMGYTITEAWSVSAGVTYVDSLDNDNLREKSAGGLLDTNAYCLLGVSYSF